MLPVYVSNIVLFVILKINCISKLDKVEFEVPIRTTGRKLEEDKCGSMFRV